MCIGLIMFLWLLFIQYCSVCIFIIVGDIITSKKILRLALIPFVPYFMVLKISIIKSIQNIKNIK